MNKILKRSICFILCLTMVLSTNLVAFAAEAEPIDPYTITGQYVEELVTYTEEEIVALPITEAEELFEEAFNVSANNFTEEEIRLALDGWAFALKYQSVINWARAASTTSDQKYYGSIGLAWVRDTTSSGTPLTLGEILSGCYTLEVDYISWDTAATLLAASSDYNVYEDLVTAVGAGATGSTLTTIICVALGITNPVATTIASTVVGAAVGVGWNYLASLDRDRMHECFTQMGRNDYMKVQFMWASNMVNKFYTVYTPSSNNFANPFPGTYGTWYTGKFGYLYNL